jgi:carbamoyltransferase
LAKILGIAPDMWISSAALLVDGKVVAAAPEERFNRQKMSRAFPARAIEYCLSEAGCRLEDIDLIAIPWNPGSAIRSASSRYIQAPQWRGDYLYAFAAGILNMRGNPVVTGIEEIINSPQGDSRIVFIDHHQSHVASTYFASPFERAAVLTIDGRGEDESCTWNLAEGSKIEKLSATVWPHSLGLVYSTITEFLGFAPHTDEWKVMALAAYGKETSKYLSAMRGLVEMKENGDFEVDLSYFSYFLFDKQPTLYCDKLVRLLGAPRQKDAPVEERHFDIAWALQKVFEDCVAYILEKLHAATGCNDLALAGGSAMNSVFNGKIADLSPFERVYVPPWPDDSGVSIGAALWAYHEKFENPIRVKQQGAYLGPSYDTQDIGELLKSYKLAAVHEDDIAVAVARLLADGKLVGWFQGRMEFGQRALGNRSILADPRDPETTNIVNKAVKFREAFRPFAPAILEEATEDYFELPTGTRVPFMEKVFPVNVEKRKEIPAVVFIDGSGRLQTVSKDTNPRFHRLISAFKDITGVPVVLNTSFNLNGEPIVCNPTDAIRTFHSCGLDALAMEDWLIVKENT